MKSKKENECFSYQSKDNIANKLKTKYKNIRRNF